ncbi:MAG: hypothetical protein A3H45_15175 [Ignavibacteria bacterium RIFCSPLOWO2_02_FULL_55_14]|nr:MAG: hypothetical protein A2X68_01710 [Ignavibacteria bacterium GWC2_56_12]OGU73990.1 MAG: hypothetical protein A3H45_15175 [Ignavibacteria bacterium RIFCSPLOWO2_02_FULL_55_14]HAV23808.1 hypothetical protein [Bacteroidota bacterium]
MEYRSFGKTGLTVSAVGFGAWAIGGPVMAGSTPIGWGPSDDAESVRALKRAFDVGITFYDTADFYGLGRSEDLIGSVFGNNPRVVIATKVGNCIGPDGSPSSNYSKAYIVEACTKSLRRLQREAIDLYQLHTARLTHLDQGECIAAMEQLQQEGKVRAWGLSLSTFAPGPEADFLVDRSLGSGFQIVLNILNRRGLSVISRAAAGYGIIVRMPLQFGLLAGTFDRSTTFPPNDHRSFRLSADIIESVNELLKKTWERGRSLGISPAELALSYAASVPGVATIIPGIRTAAQAERNAQSLVALPSDLLEDIKAIPDEALEAILESLKKRG